MDKRILVALVVIALTIIPIAFLTDSDSEATTITGTGTSYDPYRDTIDIGADEVDTYFQQYDGINRRVMAGTNFNITKYTSSTTEIAVTSISTGSGLTLSNGNLTGQLTDTPIAVTFTVESDDGIHTTSNTYTIYPVKYKVTFVGSPSGAGGANQSTLYVVDFTQYSAGSLSNSIEFYTGEVIVPVANPGYEFDHWSSTSGYITRDTTITAYFNALPNPVVSFVSNPSGLNMGLSSITVPVGTTATVSGRTITFSDGHTVTAPETIGNYVFQDWYPVGTGGQGITSDKTFTATYVSYNYSLSFDGNGNTGGTVPSTMTSGPTSSSSYNFTIPYGVPTKTGYSFVGWSFYTTGVVSTYQPGETVTLYSSLQTRTLHAIWGYTVTFTTDSHGTVDHNSITKIMSGTAITVSDNTVTINGTTVTATPSYGYRFGSWTSGGSLPATVTDNMTITANFTELNKYIVTFNSTTGGTVDVATINNIYEGTAITVLNNTITIGNTTVTATPNSASYTFVNWTVNGGSVPSTVSANMTITANFTSQYAYSLSYNANGGTGAPSTQSQSSTATSYSFTVSNVIPTRSGYTFLGWANTSDATVPIYSGGDTITLQSSNPTKTIYAVWYRNPSVTGSGTQADPYTYLDIYGSGAGILNSSYVKAGTSITITNNDYDDVDYLVNDVTSGHGLSVISSGLSGTLTGSPGDTVTVVIDYVDYGGDSGTYYYTFTIVDDVTYTLTYDANGGTGAPATATATTTELSKSFTVSNVIPTRSGYTFLGWSLQYPATSVDKVAGDTVTVSWVADGDSVTLYAVWGCVVNFTAGANGSIDYNSINAIDGDTISISSNRITISGTTVTATADAGYMFQMWTANGGSVPSTVSANMTITANFANQIQYSITYDANGGTGAPATQGPYTSSEPFYTIICSDTIPTYTGKVFLGWSRTTDVVDEHSGRAVILYPSEPSITLTAVWYTPEYQGSGIEHHPYTSIKIPVSQMHMLNGMYVSEGADIEIVGDDLGGTYAQVGSVTPGYGLTISNGTLTGEISSDSGTVNIKGYTTDGTYSTLWKDVTFTISAVFTLNFDVGDGAGGPGLQTGYSTGSYYDFIISGQVPVMADYDFVGWDSQYTAIHAEYQPGDTYRVTAMDDRMGTLYAVWIEHSYVTTYWSNGEQNGSVSVLYHMDSPTTQSYNIIETMNLYKYNEGGVFTPTNYKVYIEAHNVISGVSYSVLISATYYNGDDVIASDTVNIGKWANFIITVNPLENEITYTKVNNFASFQQYGTRETGKVIDLDTGMDSMTVYEIGFGYLNEAPRQQVVATKVFLNTYNVVMKDPTFDIDDYWPNQTNIRFALFSFALYGSTVTLNGYTFTVDKSKITLTYYIDNDKNYIYNPENPPDNIQPVTKSLTLTNLYITWQDGHCYLTFNDANGWTIDMGTYTDREISMEGIWYFQSGMYESYTETETSIVKNWTLFDFDFRVFGLIALGLLVLAGVVMRMMTDAKLGDYLILFGAIGVMITMIGGLL